MDEIDSGKCLVILYADNLSILRPFCIHKNMPSEKGRHVRFMAYQIGKLGKFQGWSLDNQVLLTLLLHLEITHRHTVHLHR